MSKVAVIGSGIFGATIALKLQGEGHQVTVFERLPAPLGGASYNNQNRLHLGYHYPRDMETARQCIKGFDAFKKTFPECIVSGFPNAYFVASEGSKTTPEDYMTFCDALGLEHEMIALDTFEPHVQGVALGLLTQEVVYDSALLGKHIARQLHDAATDVQFNTEVTNIEPRGDQLVLTTSAGTESFDAVVNATYASISRLAGALGLPLVERQYEYTAVPIIETPFAQTGVTIMDGSFMTVLPFGNSGNHLLYHVDHTVIDRAVSTHLDRSWLDQATSPFSRIDAQGLFEKMRDATSRFVPALKDARLKGFLHGPRMVLARRDDTDARPSIIDQPLPGYISVFSGKIDHCMWVADEVAQRLQ